MRQNGLDLIDIQHGFVIRDRRLRWSCGVCHQERPL
jgi:hypothetical protein